MAQDIASLLVRIEATTQQMRRELAQGESAVGGFSKKLDGQLKSVDTAFDRAGKSAQSAMNVMRGAMAIAAGAGALGAVIKQADAYGQMASRIKMVTTDTAEYYAVQKRLMEISDRTYKPIQEQQELFIRSSKAMKELGYSTAETIDFIDSASSSLTINAASADSGRRAIDALSKSMVTGTVRGDEWNAVLEIMPTAVSDIAKHLGTTETAVKQMAQSGKLSMDTFVKSMIGAREANAQLAEQMPTTVGDAMIRLGNHFSAVVGEINSAQGATAGLAEKINELSVALRDGDVVAGAIEGFTNWAAAVRVISEEISALRQLVREATSEIGDSSFSIGEAFSQMPVNLRAAVQIAVVEVAHFVDGVLNKTEAAAAYLKALPGGLESAAQAYDSVRTRMQANDGAREESLEAIFAERDALLETGKAAAKAYLDQHNANTRISTERTASVKQLTKEEEDSAKRIAAAAKKSADAKLKALDSLISKYDPAAKAQAEYEKGIALADEALLKGKYTTEQYQKVVQGLYTDLNKPIWDKHNKQAKEAADAIKKIDDQLESVRDRLDPVRAATKRLTAEKKLLKARLDAGRVSLEEYTQNVALLEKEYDDNTRATSDWAKWTEGALDRVDSAFADAWRNIGDGFDGFRDNLTNAFKQMLAELAHIAITKPIIIQIGASMGIGGGTQGNNGIWGSLLGGSSGGAGGGMGGALQAANQARSIYSMYGTAQTLLPVLQGGYASGGIGGALTGIGSYVGSLFGGAGTASSMAAGSTAAGYTGSAYASWAAAQGAGSAAGAGASAGVGGALSSVGGMLSNPVTWIVAGMVASNKLYSQGVRADGSKTAEYAKDSSTIGKVAWAPFTVGSYAVEKMDKLLGSVFGSKFTAIVTGSPVFQAITDFIGGGIFGGKWQTKDVGIGLGIEGGSLDAQQYEYQKKKGGWFKKNKKRTLWSDLDPETAAALQETYDATEAGVSAIFEALSLSVEEGSLDGLQLARTKISTKGKTEEEIQQAIAEWFGSAADAMTAELNKVFATGLDLDFEGMQAFVGNLQGVNEVLRYLDVGMYDASVAGGKLAEALSAAAGGLESLAANSATYYGAFFSEAEKIEDTIDSIKRTFESADVELAASREAYRAMVEDIDLTTEAGQEMFATLMALSGQAAQYFSIVEQQAAQAAAMLMGSVSNAYASLQRSIASQQRAIQESAGKTASSINALTGIGNSLDAALKRLRGTSDDAVRSLRAQAVMTLNSALVQARSGQSLAGVEGLQDALDTASQMDTALYGSLADFEREQGRTANLIADLEKINGKQLTVEQQMLKQFEAQLSRLDQELLFAQAQLDALNGVDASVLSVAEAIKAMNASVVAALSLMGGDTGKNATPGNVGTLADSVYRSVLGREADAAGLAYWQGQVASGAIRLDQLEQAIKNAAKANGEIPAFAKGGLHAGGLRLVGENGPELEVTGPSRIYNASQTAAMMGGGDTARAMASLQQSVERQGDALRSIAKHTMQTARRVEFLERWDFDGLPTERDVA